MLVVGDWEMAAVVVEEDIGDEFLSALRNAGCTFTKAKYKKGHTITVTHLGASHTLRCFAILPSCHPGINPATYHPAQQKQCDTVSLPQGCANLSGDSFGRGYDCGCD